MTPLRVLVVDDEPLAREMVADLVRADPEIGEVVECGDAAAAARAIARQQPDIVFLDIEMPGQTGIELAGRLGPDGPVTVFITAFGRYALQAFDVQATDYVVKPFSDARFMEALERAKIRVRERRLLELAERAASEAGENGRIERLTLRDGDRSIVIDVSEISWIEAQDYYVRIHSAHGRHLVRATLASLADRLDPQRFLRVHRGAIVNLDLVTSIAEGDDTRVTLAGGAEVPVSRARRRALRAALMPRLRPR